MGEIKKHKRKREESKITVHTNLKEATFRGEYGDMAIVSASTSSAHSYWDSSYREEIWCLEFQWPTKLSTKQFSRIFDECVPRWTRNLFFLFFSFHSFSFRVNVWLALILLFISQLHPNPIPPYSFCSLGPEIIHNSKLCSLL